MQLTEKTIIHSTHPQYVQIKNLCHLSKNLYNASLYDARQHYFTTGKHKQWQQQRVDFVASNQPDYRALPAKIAGETVKLVGQNFNSFFGLLKAKKQGKVTQQVRLPKYLPKDGHQVVIIPKDALSKKVVEVGAGLYKHVICPKSLNLEVLTRQSRIDVVRFVPRGNHIIQEVVYTVPKVELLPDNGRYAAIDPNVSNLCLTSNVVSPVLFNLKPLKSINQKYNKDVAVLNSRLPKGVKTSKRIKEVTGKRNSRIDWEAHNIATDLVNFLASNKINTLVIGHNLGWKQSVRLGRKNNQAFVQLPFTRIFELISYKAARAGIRVIITEESYSSQASFFDQDVVPVYKKGVRKTVKFSGKRVRRSVYRTGSGRFVHADVNGSGNILRKVVPDSIVYAGGIEGFAVSPRCRTVPRIGLPKP